MNKIAFLLLSILAGDSFCNACDLENIAKNPGLYLNPQDVPIFFEDSPLTGMAAFALIPPFVKQPEMQKKIRQTIEEELRTAGEVVQLKCEEMRGFGTGNFLVIQMGNVTAWNGTETDMSRISLHVETSVDIRKTGMNTFPMVWTINAFLQGQISSLPEGELLKALQKLIHEFVQNYQYANQEQKKRAVFYVYE